MNERPWYQYLILGLILGLLAYMAYLKPKQATLKSVRAERIQVEDQVAKLQIKKRQIDKLQAELAELGKAIAELEPLIPAKKEEGEILRSVQQLAFDTQLDVLRFSPDREIPKDYYNEKPIAVEVKLSATPQITKGFWTAMEDLSCKKGYVVYPGKESYPIGDAVTALPLRDLDRIIEVAG